MFLEIFLSYSIKGGLVQQRKKTLVPLSLGHGNIEPQQRPVEVGKRMKLSSPGPKPFSPKPKTEGPWADTKML